LSITEHKKSYSRVFHECYAFRTTPTNLKFWHLAGVSVAFPGLKTFDPQNPFLYQLEAYIHGKDKDLANEFVEYCFRDESYENDKPHEAIKWTLLAIAEKGHVASAAGVREGPETGSLLK